ncbi:MAG: hypothetical protein ACJKSS_01855 [Patescibacteria group bacterium UBA2103]
MKKIINKKLGETPLEALQRTTKDKATYVGRLDPMATGELLILSGKDVYKKEHYQNLDKEYVVEVLLDISTDTGDILGMPIHANRHTRASNNILKDILKKEVGTKTLPYPHFSSKPVNGKPLFLHALEGTLKDIEIPTHEETFYRIELLRTKLIDPNTLYKKVQHLLKHAPISDDPRKTIGKDFRQEEIKKTWMNTLWNNRQHYQIITIKVTCGSGAYMRSLAERIGRHLGTNACALSIHRNKIGRYTTILSIPFFIPIRLT